VESPDYYVRQCFDYVVTSSDITDRYATPAARARHPEAAAFYDRIARDPRFEVVYQVSGRPWERTGPAITIRRINHRCA
jgi:hypothetical protein